MAFNGAGVFTRLYNWQNDRDAGIKIRADRMDGELDGIATGLSTCLTKDGQQVPTANIPMGGYKFTGMGAGVGAGNSVRWEQVLGTISTPTQIAADQNDYAPSGYATTAVMRISSDAARNITGINAAVGMGLLQLVNVGSYPITLKNASASSATANQFAFGADYVIGARESVRLVYDTASTAWRLDNRVWSSPAASDGAALGSATLQWSDLFLATGGVINWGNGNVTLTHSTGLLTLSSPLSLGTSNAATVGTVELGHATDTTLSRASAGKLAVEGHTVLTGDEAAQTVSGGARVTVYDNGTKSSGTFTPDPGNCPMQKANNNGAHTLAPGTNYGNYILTYTNGASAGAITTSGWTKVGGDSFDTTSGHKFRCQCVVDGDGSTLTVMAMQ